MTELDVPRPVIVDIDRIGDYLNIVRVVTDKIGEDRADKGLHTAAVVRRNSSYQQLTIEYEYTFLVP